ncbi:unnamed protein product [marine sediment metagenome]|uniref:Uncharacterized protein n=1 Tax=marine sediment metagenome TaxID=412755 RepID=X1P6E1_9ZZZZ
MAKQLGKRFSDEEVKMLLEKYLSEKVELSYLLEILGIKRRTTTITCPIRIGPAIMLGQRSKRGMQMARRGSTPSVLDSRVRMPAPYAQSILQS